MKVAVVGATGLVGSVMLKILEERNFPVSEILPVASASSAGKKISVRGEPVSVIPVQEAIDQAPAFALFSAGAAASKELAPGFASMGTVVIDNSSCWRMDPHIPLVVPEINGHVLNEDSKIIANPNCSTIQMVMVIHPLHKKYSVKRIVVSTYQSVSGTGKKAVNQMMAERNGGSATRVYPYPIDLNCIPHIDSFLENEYTKEEMKMVNETRKIMGDDSLQISATCIRIPVVAGHSESVNVEFRNDFSMEDVKSILAATSGVTVLDKPSENVYPMPLTAAGKDDVFVGRLRKDYSQPNSLNCWIVSDNLRKGAATNAVQIAEYMLAHNLVAQQEKV